MRSKALRLVEPDAPTAPVAAPEADSLPDVLTQREAAAFLRMHVSTLIRHGDSVPHRRVGMVPKYSRRMLLAYIEGREP